MTIDQIGIILFGVAAVWLTQDPREWLRKYACLFGMAGQPFWFVAAIDAQQWGVFVVCVLYTLSWMRGIWHHWLEPLWRDA